MTTQRTTGRSVRSLAPAAMPDRPDRPDRPERPGPLARRGRRTRLAVAAGSTLLAGATLLAGCGSDSPASTASASPTSATSPAAPTSTPLSAPNSPAPGGQPTGTASPTATSTPTRSAGGSQAQAPDAELPHDGGDYGGELISAWTAGDRVAIKRLTSAAAAATITAKKAPTGLILTTCEDDLCSWSSESGARLTLTFDAAKLAGGEPHAILAAKVF